MAFASVWRFFLTQATAFDMRRVADALQLLFPRVKVVSLQAVAAHTRESLTKQASLVTKEILSVLKTAEWLRISFISHSIGSLVLRLAIQSPLLNPYRSKYHLFLSLNAPHLGVLFPKWTLEWGSKFVSFFNDAKVVQELLLKEEKKQRNTLLYKMALNSGWDSSTVSCRVRGVSLPVLLFVMSGYVRSVPFGAGGNEPGNSGGERSGGRSLPGDGEWVLEQREEREAACQGEEV